MNERESFPQRLHHRSSEFHLTDVKKDKVVDVDHFHTIFRCQDAMQKRLYAIYDRTIGHIRVRVLYVYCCYECPEAGC